MARLNYSPLALGAVLLVVAAATVARSRAADCPPGTIITVAGTGLFPYSGEGGPAIEANIKPSAVVLGADGIYVADAASHRVFLIDPAGIIRTVAGNGRAAFAGDGGPATEGSVNEPRGLAIGPDGSLYIAEAKNHRIRKVDPNGIITKIAGNGAAAYTGDGGPAVRASLNWPNGLAVGGDGSVYVADTGNNRIRKVDPQGLVTTVAGTGEFAAGSPPPEDPFSAWGRDGDGGPATKARLFLPQDVGLARDGSLYIADTASGRVRKIGTDGVITTVAGKGLVRMMEESEYWWQRKEPPPTGDGGPATEARVGAAAIDLAADGSLYIVEMLGSVRKVDPRGIITTVTGAEHKPLFSGDGGRATEATLNMPRGVAVGADGSLYIADEGNYRVRKINPEGIITTIAGNGQGEWSGDGGAAVGASLYMPYGVAVGGDGSLYIADTRNNRIRKVDPTGVITTVAGKGPSGLSIDEPSYEEGPAIEADVFWPHDVELGGDGSLYIAEPGRICKVDPAGVITTVAGDPKADGFGDDIGDGGPATEAALSFYGRVALDPYGRVYIADGGHNRIRQVRLTGSITTVAGKGEGEYSGDGGPATRAGLDFPTGVAIGNDGSIYIAERSNHRIRKVDPDGIITTVAGSGPGGHKSRGYSGDGGRATRARLASPMDVAIGPDGCVYIADRANHRVRKIDRKGIITTVAGSGPGGHESAGFSGDGGPATKARLRSPTAIAFGPDGSLYIADTGNDRIRKVCGVAAHGK